MCTVPDAGERVNGWSLFLKIQCSGEIRDTCVSRFIQTHRTKSCLVYTRENPMKLNSTLGILQETADMTLIKFNIQTLRSITVPSVGRALSVFVFLSVCCSLSLCQPVLNE